MSGTVNLLTYPGKPISFASTYGTRPDPTKNGKGPAACPLTLPFSPSAQGYAISLQQAFPFGVDNIQTIYIDNGQSPFRTTVTFPGASETVIAEPFTRGWYPVSTSALTLNVVNLTTSSSFNVGINVYNYIIPPMVINATQLVLGDMDVVLPARAGTLYGSIQYQLGSTTALQITGFVPGIYAAYYVTNISILFSVLSTATTQQTELFLFDSPDGTLVNETKQFWSGYITAGDGSASIEVSNVMISGTTKLWAIDLTSATPWGTANFNIYGGRTNAVF